MAPCSDRDVGQRWLWQWLFVWSSKVSPSHYLNHCWLIRKFMFCGIHLRTVSQEFTLFITFVWRLHYKIVTTSTRGQWVNSLWPCDVTSHFYPRPVMASGYCRCLCVCINHLLVLTITRHLFKLGSLNLVQRSKTPWLRSLLFWGAIDLDFQGQIKLQTQIWHHFEFVQTITHHLF